MLTDRLINTAILLAAEGGAHSHPPLQFRVDTLIFSLLIFMGLAAILLKFAWKPIMEGLDAREKKVADNIENARLAKEQADSNLKQYEEKLAGVNDEATAIIAEAKQDALAAKDKIVSEAKDEANREREKAFADIASAKDAAVRELAEKSVDSAVSLAGNIVGRSLNKNDHQNLIDQAVERFKNSSGA
jgi:F-type H+-transporting ATPase subunit b